MKKNTVKPIDINVHRFDYYVMCRVFRAVDDIQFYFGPICLGIYLLLVSSSSTINGYQKQKTYLQQITEAGLSHNVVTY